MILINPTMLILFAGMIAFLVAFQIIDAYLAWKTKIACPICGFRTQPEYMDGHKEFHRYKSSI